MMIIILIMAAGILVGRILRSKALKGMGKVITLLIWVLLFLLGVEVGSDERIFKAIPTLGGDALAITLAGIAGSMLASWLLWNWICRKRKGEK